MKKFHLVAWLLLCSFTTVMAQNEIHALRYSQILPFGTARFAAQGGASAALGGDLSSIVANPAGLGLYRSSEFMFTPSLNWVNTQSDFHGSLTEDSQLNFNVGSLGLVKTWTSNKDRGIVSASYAFAYHTLLNFNNSTTIEGASPFSSLLDDFAWHANEQRNPAPDLLNEFYEKLAFDTQLMPYDEDGEEYWHDMQLDGYGQELYRSFQQSGYIGEYSFSGALNYSNLLYLGASLGIHAVRFNEDIYHLESDVEDQVLVFDEFRFREFNQTTGWGYTARFGMILRPMQLLRIGASFQLPTFYKLRDEKYTDMDAYFDAGSGIADASDSSPTGVHHYRLRTPFRVNGNASVILGQMATLSAGYEYVDYRSAKLDAYDYEYIEENDNIRQDFQSVHQLKAGAEFRLGALYLRGGTQYLRSPFRDSQNNAESWILSGGIGFRTRGMSLDLGYSHAGRTDVYGLYAYAPGFNEVALNQVRVNKLLCTLAFKF